MRRRKLITIKTPFNAQFWCDDDVTITCQGPDGGERSYLLRTNPRGLELVGQPKSEIATNGGAKPTKP